MGLALARIEEAVDQAGGARICVHQWLLSLAIALSLRQRSIDRRPPGCHDSMSRLKVHYLFK
jgi:hypothetical protein